MWGAALLRVRSIGQTSSSFGASSFENFSAVCGSHSFAEAVLFASLSFLGLICSFHSGTSLSFRFQRLDTVYGTPEQRFHTKLMYIIIKSSAFVKGFFIFSRHSAVSDAFFRVF